MSSPFNPLAGLTPSGAASTQAAQPSQSTPGTAAAPPQAQPQTQPQSQPQSAPTNLLTPSLLTASPSLPLLASSPGLGALAGLPGISSLPGLSGVKSPPHAPSTQHNQAQLGTPWASISAAASAGAGTLSAPAPIAMPPGWVAFGASSASVNEGDADNARRALGDVARLLERAEMLRGEIRGLEGGVFGSVGEVRVDALPSLQLEYAQTLLALISLSSAYLVGALPVPLSSAAGYTPPQVDADVEMSVAAAAGVPPTGTAQAATAPAAGTGASAPAGAAAGSGAGAGAEGESGAPAAAAGAAGATGAATGTPGTGTPAGAAGVAAGAGSAGAPGSAGAAGAASGAAATGGVGVAAVGTSMSLPTTTELAGWTEERAQAQFARREGLYGASRAVIDVLKSGR